jgi:hypothetical protein
MASAIPQQRQLDELTRFESLRAEVTANVLAFSGQQFPPHTTQQFAAFLSQMQGWRAQIVAFGIPARELVAAGLPELQNRLTAFLTDFDHAHQTFTKMAGSAAEHERAVAGIMQGSAQHMQTTIQDVTKSRQATFDAMMDRWRSR